MKWKNSGPAVLVLTAVFAHAETEQETAIGKLIGPSLRNGAKVESVIKTPYGLYEVRTKDEIVYTDEKAQYLFIGRIIDTRTRQDLTQARTDQINRIEFAGLPLDAALKTVKGNGKRVIAIFEDPNCGYCKRFRQTTLKEIDNVTVYTFMYNILSEDSIIKSRNIWCAPDRNAAWDAWMLQGKAAPAAPVSCETPHARVMALGKAMKLSGTPTLFFMDGHRIAGAAETQTVENKFASLAGK